MSAVYNYRGSPSAGIVTKFDDDLNIESSYTIEITDGKLRCGCPAGARPSCRHRQMFTQLRERMNTAWFLDFDTRQWVDPTGEAALSQPEPASTPLRTTGNNLPPYSGEPVDHSDAIIAADEKLNLPPRDNHPFRRRM